MILQIDLIQNFRLDRGQVSVRGLNDKYLYLFYHMEGRDIVRISKSERNVT